MSVVTLPEFQNYMSGIRMTEIQQLDAVAILDGVQSELEIYINRPLQQRRMTEQVECDPLGRVFLSVTPIVSVYGVYRTNIDGTQGEVVDPDALPQRWFTRGGNFLTLNRGGVFFIDYLGGVNADIVPAVKLAIKRVAAREYVAKHGDNMVVQSTELRPPEDPTPIPKGWTDEELAKFDRLRRRTVV